MSDRKISASVSISQDVWKKLEQSASQTRMNRSQIVQLLIERYLNGDITIT